MPKFDPSAPPFWERDKGGPITDWMRGREQVPLIKKLHRLQDEALRLEFLYARWGKSLSFGRYPEVIDEIAVLESELGFHARKPRPTELQEYCQDPEPTALLRVGGSDGNGNRWRGHGNVPSRIAYGRRR